MPVSEAQKKSAKKYPDRNNKRFGVIMKKWEAEILERYLKNSSYTLNGFTVKAIKEKIERDTCKNFEEFMREYKEEQEQNVNS